MNVIKLYLQNFMNNKKDICHNFHELLQIVYILCKTRNYKAIIEYFPHEVKDLEPVIFYLSEQKTCDLTLWESKYVLLLWLSIIILVPFDLVTIDSEKSLKG